MAREGINVAAQQINQVCLRNPLPRLRGCFYTFVAKCAQHVNPENINHGFQIARDGINVAAQHIHQVCFQDRLSRPTVFLWLSIRSTSTLKTSTTVSRWLGTVLEWQPSKLARYFSRALSHRLSYYVSNVRATYGICLARQSGKHPPWCPDSSRWRRCCCAAYRPGIILRPFVFLRVNN